jgi:hydrogenase/urease accessory protein HupE
VRFAGTLLRVAFATLFWLVARSAFAHIGSGLGGGFSFSHPLLGPDHLLAMVSVGIRAQNSGRRSSGCCQSHFRSSSPSAVPSASLACR